MLKNFDDRFKGMLYTAHTFLAYALLKAEADKNMSQSSELLWPDPY
jgi:hypothetical protein